MFWGGSCKLLLLAHIKEHLFCYLFSLYCNLKEQDLRNNLYFIFLIYFSSVQESVKQFDIFWFHLKRFS